MSGPGAGFEYPPKSVSWLKRDALLFANSIGCTVDELHFLYVNLSILPVSFPFLFALLASTHLWDLIGKPSELRYLPHVRHHPTFPRNQLRRCRLLCYPTPHSNP